MTGVLVTLIYTCACTGAGLLALRALAGPAWLNRNVDVPAISSALILGQALVSATWLLLGLAGLLLPWLIWSIIVLLVVGSHFAGLTTTQYTVAQARIALRWWLGETIAIQLTATSVALLVAGFAIAAWLKPPYGDAEAFYVTYARIIAATGRVEPMPGLYETFSSIGMVGEPHFAALIAVAGVPAAKLFIWPLALAAAAMLHSIGKVSRLGPRGELFLLAMLFTTTAFTHHIWDGKVDLFAAALGLLAVRWILIARDPAMAQAGLAVAGFGAGFAVVAKFSYAVSLGPALLVLLLWPSSGPSVLRKLITVGACAVVATLPHLVKNALLFAAPLAPFFGGTSDQNWLQQIWFAPDVVRRIILTYPFALTFGRYPMQSGNLSFLLIAFLPLLRWLPRNTRLRDSVLLQLCLAGLAGILTWLILRPSIIAPRYLLTVLLLFYPLVARAVEYMMEQEASPHWISHGVVATTLAACAIFSYPLFPIIREAGQQFSGNGSNPCALASTYCNPLLRLNAAAQPGDRVYVLNYYTFWLRDDLLQCRDRGGETKWPRAAGGPGLSWNALAAGDFKWLLVDRGTHNKEYLFLLTTPRPEYLHQTVIHENGDVLLIRLENTRAENRRHCRHVGRMSWSPESARSHRE